MKVRICLVALCLSVFYCSAAYGQTAEWEYKQLLNNLKDWPDSNEYSLGPSLSCDGFTFQVDAYNAHSGYFSITLTDPAFKKLWMIEGKPTGPKNERGSSCNRV
jgi:hypothetical protein